MTIITPNPDLTRRPPAQHDASNRAEPRGRERILQEARRLFLERGFLDVSMREIAEAAGLRKATVYHHFRDKEELFIAITLEEMAAVRARMEESIAGLTGLPERLEQLAFVQFSQLRGHWMRLARDFREHIPESRHDEIHAELDQLFTLYQRIFEEAATTGEIEDLDPKFAACSFFQTVHSWTWDFPDLVGAERKGPRELARTAVRLHLFGVASPALRKQARAEAKKARRREGAELR
jgi:AcrR family transcriptional regulator